MNNPIIASYRRSKDEFLLCQRLAMQHAGLGRWLYRITNSVGIILVLSGVVALSQGVGGGLSGLLCTIILASIFFAMPLIARRASLRLYAQMPDRDKEMTWEITSDRVSWRTDIGLSELSWNGLTRVVKLSEGFLLYPNDRIFLWLPVHAFRNEVDVTNFAELAKTKVRQFEDAAENHASSRRDG